MNDDHPPARHRLSEAAAGLDFYRLAVIWRLVIVLVAIAYVAIQLLTPHRTAEDGGGGFGLLLGLGEAISILMALIGAARFAARTPDGVASTAGFAPLCLAVALILEIYCLYIAVRVLQFNSAASHATSEWGLPSIGNLEDHLNRLPYVRIAASLAALLSTLSIVGAIGSIGRAIGNRALVDRGVGVGVAIVILAIGYALLQKTAVGSHSSYGTLVGVIVIAIYGIGVLVAFIGLLNGAVTTMRAGGPVVATARVIES